MQKRRATAWMTAVLAIVAAACDAFSGDGTASSPPSDGGIDRADASTTDAAVGPDSSCASCARTPETLIDGEATPRFVRVHKDTIYWALDSSVVRMCKIESCRNTVTTIGSGYARIDHPSDLAVDDTGVYLAIYLKQVIYRINPGAEVAAVAEYDLGNGPAPYGVAVDGTHVVWTEQTPDGVRVATGVPDAGAFLSNASVGFIRAIALGEGTAFWLSGDTDNAAGRVDSIGLDGRGPISRYGVAGPRGIAATKQTAFVTSWSTNGPPNIGTVIRYTGETRDELAVNQPEPGPIVTDGTTVYWANLGDSSIRSCAVGGCTLKESPVTKINGRPESLAVDAKALYWCDSVNGTIQRILKE
jgi:streptogramin lyase